MVKIHLTEKSRKILLKLLTLLIGSIFLTAFLEYRYFLHDTNNTLNFIFGRPLVFLFNSFLMFLMAVFLSGFLVKPFRTLGFLWSVAIIISYVNISKFIIRGTPLLPEDFQLAEQTASLSKFIDFFSVAKVVLAVLIVYFLSRLLDHLTRRFFAYQPANLPKNWWKRHAVLERTLTIVLAIAIFTGSIGFIRHRAGGRKDHIDWLNTDFIAWNQTDNYNANGFLMGFIYNFSKFKLHQPDGYSKEKIQAIQKKYSQQKKQDEKHNKRTSLKKADFNIVYILNESFIDANNLKGQYPFAGDIVPNLHRIFTNHPSGDMYSLDYGGGTATIEFEADTGLSNYWANTVPFTNLLPKLKSVPSIASYAKNNGYDTVAIHPFNGGMYKRNISLKVEGFDRFITENDMNFKEKDGNSQYINDRSSYKQVLKEIKSHKKKQMISLITMQNHSPYDANIYKTHHFQVGGMEDEPEQKSSVETYLETLHSSDRYLGEFIDELDKLPEKTVVLFYGDHSPGVFSKTNDHTDKNIRDISRRTPYFIYTNFTPHDASGKGHKLPTITPNCFNNTVLDILNIKKPAYLYLTNQVCKSTPILTQAYYGDGAPFKSTVLSEYELLNYDILGGKQYWTQK